MSDLQVRPIAARDEERWRELFQGYVTFYEATVADFESQVRALIDYAGLPWNDACLKFNEAKTQVSTISTWQVRQPIYNTSVKRWKVYEKHLGPLIEGLGDLAVAE